MRPMLLVALALALGLAGRAAGVVSVEVADATVTLAEVQPQAGQPALRWSTSDFLRFTNDGATEPQLVVYTASHLFRYDRDATTSASTVTHQGVATRLSDNAFATPVAAGDFLPLSIVTTTDRTGQAGWTKHAGCGTVNYQGEMSVPWYSNAGVGQTALLRHYQVCDDVELYLDTDNSLGDADLAYVKTHMRLFVNAQDHLVTIQGVEFAFGSAASATAVTLQQARFTNNYITEPAQLDLHFLYRFPDGFPAGVTTTTLTATATDIST